jgi:hypothetical protein
MNPPAAMPSARSIDLHTHLEELISAVWQAEANWGFDDRLDMSLRINRTNFRS